MKRILRNSTFGGEIIYIKKIAHLNFSDSPYLAPQFILKLMKVIGQADRYIEYFFY